MIVLISVFSLHLMPETDLILMKSSNELDRLMEIGICLATSERDVILMFVFLEDFCVRA